MSEAKNVEQYWEEDSSSDERQAAFQVDDDDDDDGDGDKQDDGVIPTSAAEYLRMVRRQASAMPNVFVADAAQESATTEPGENASQFGGESSAIASTRMAPMPVFAKPDEAWRQDLLSWFPTLQETIARKKQNSDPEAAKNPNIPDASNGSRQKWRRLIYDEKHHVKPSADMLSQLDYMQINTALEVLDVCLGEVHPVPRDGSVSDASKRDGGRIRDDICTGHRSSWLFSLLANLQLPLLGPTAATLRSILRKLTFARLAVESPNDKSLATLNVLIVILAHHFGQGEVAAFKFQ